MSEGFDVEEWCEANLDRWTKSAGTEWTSNCPVCSGWGCFYVNADTGAFVCFKCSGPDGDADFKGRDATGLIAEVEGITWAEAKRWIFKNAVKLRRKDELFTLADRIRGLRVSGDDDDEVDDGPVEYDLPKAFRPVWTRKGGWAVPVYLRERGIKRDTARKWNIGYCRVGDYRNRLIIPIICPNGYSFTGRTMDDEDPKYKNPTGADHRRLLIGWDVVRRTGDLCIVEGPLDAVKFDQHGIPAFAVGGKILHSEQLEMLFKLSPSQAITVVLDPEERLGPLNIASQLECHFDRIYIARLPDKVDPGDSTKKQAKRAVSKAEKFDGGRSATVKARLDGVRDRIADRYS